MYPKVHTASCGARSADRVDTSVFRSGLPGPGMRLR